MEFIYIPYATQSLKKKYIERDDSIYGVDKNGKEYKITPSMVEAYKKKYGKENTVPLHVAGGLGLGVLGGLISTLKLSSWEHALDGNDDLYRLEKIAAPFQAASLAGGAYFGREMAKHKMYNDIVGKRLKGEI